MSVTRLFQINIIYLVSPLLLQLFPYTSFAQLSNSYSSVRALGMGNAFTAVVRDADALFYNPSGLALIKGVQWTIADPRIGADGTQAYTDYQNYQGNSNSATFLEGLYGQNLWLGGGAKTSVAIPDFAVAGYTYTEGSFELTNPAFPSLDANYFFDYGVATGLGFEVVPDIFRVGFSVRRFNRTGNNTTITASTLAQLNTSQIQNQLANRGTGYGLNVGAAISLPTPVKPTLSFSILDAGGTAFTFEQGGGPPPAVPQDMIVGGSLELDGPGFRITPAADMRFVDRPDIQLFEKISVGVEMELLILSLRAGLNQGYYTAGVGLNLGLLRVDLATYGVELGAYAGQLQDRRYMAELTMELDFDPAKLLGGSGSSSSESSGLKQRR